MLFLEYLKTVLIGIVEGITEWLPVSSTGHMILVERIFPFTEMSDAVYDMFLYVVQLAAILAVVVYFFSRLNPFSGRKSKAECKETWHIWLKVLVGVTPAAVVGLALDELVDQYVVDASFGVFVIAGALILYGILYIVLERTRGKREFRINTLGELTYRDAILIGLFQCLSILPGTSRSGSTILGGMCIGVSRVASAEFSFFMAIPIMLGISLLKVGKFTLKTMTGVQGYAISANEVGMLLVASVVAFAVSLFCVKFLMDFVRRHSFEIFGWYRIGLGLLVTLYFLIV